MKISDQISNLQKLLADHGDVDCIVSIQIGGASTDQPLTVEVVPPPPTPIVPVEIAGPVEAPSTAQPIAPALPVDDPVEAAADSPAISPP